VRFIRTVGSNPTLSAILSLKPLILLVVGCGMSHIIAAINNRTPQMPAGGQKAWRGRTYRPGPVRQPWPKRESARQPGNYIVAAQVIAESPIRSQALF
jgi:hypothetical protein